MNNPNDVSSPDFWQKKYDDHNLPWDTGTGTPVFKRLIDSGVLPAGSMLVVGAGTGHDARLFARNGYEVTAIDFAAGAIAAMHEAADPAAPLDIRQADLFNLPPEFTAAFDYVLEYSVFCAIDPQQRADYVAAVDSTLKLGGVLVALVLPLSFGPGGPPFEVDPNEFIGYFAARGYRLVLREMPHDSIPPRRGNEELLILQKAGS